jgi:integrase
MNIAELLDKYHTEIVPRHSPNTQKDYAWHIARLKKVFGHIDVKELKPRDVGTFLDTTEGKVSRNRSISVLSAAYSKAVGRWWLADVNPCLKVERNDTKPRDRYISDAEFDAVREIQPDRMQIAMDLALLTSQRQGDLLNLTWAQIGPDGIYFRQGKTGKRLIVTITPELKEVLTRSRQIDTGMARLHLVRTTDGTPFTSEGFRANWQRYMRIALARSLIKLRFTFHDLRAKCVSDTKDLQEASHRAGHQNMGITRAVYDRNVRRVSALR